ncbi:MAG: hypothetical protein LBQ43_01695, partial [Holosporales bacterium]|nr:hypothetical protein [Holosporales bacterium]
MNISKLLKSSLLLVAFCAGGNYSGYADLGDPVPEEPVDVPELASLSALELTNLLGANFQARINQDQADINRAAVGGTFLPDFFEPFFHVERAIDAYNEIVASFNAVYPGTTEVYKGTASTSVFEAVEKDGEFFTFVGNLRQYMSRTLVDKGERGGLLKAIYEATLKPEDPLEADVVGAFEGTIASTLGESKGLDVADMTYPTSWDQEDNFKTRFGEVVHLADGVLALGNNTLATAAAALNALFT